MNLINLRNIKKNYHTKTKEIKALDNISFNVKKGEFLSIVGPSGCGKSTLLNIIAKLEKETEGVITNNEKLRIGYMMQNDCLLSWLTVRENATLGLTLKKIKNKENLNYVDKLLKKYGLYEYKDQYPDNLSGGMKQRVALIRTLAIKPNILLLDEPFSKLDIDTRLRITDDVKQIIDTINITTILISHDIKEALSLSNRVIVLSSSPGNIKNIYNIDLKKHIPSERIKERDFKKYYNMIESDFEYVKRT